ncbi:hypothetical protein DK842_20765 [Chromobacterium phragmitis]|uniref:DUF3955 domain-containing protein n=1 Tax=Chromobacterium phragmitis TaxID=2202141 RepID=A0A344UE10_9NEIS|nr:DUF3955 domain-containing protein [Chromobacterium phragmitis]AXE32116.1 hypothetical protein DK842_20765 [Chromobacterium phragmitis]AXE33508.1 hypothetical protein DK843_03755 [Chromobacterium phragmitis]
MSRSLKFFLIVVSPLAAAGLACLGAAGLIGSHVDANGVLREPFALIAGGSLLMVASAVAAAACLLWKGLAACCARKRSRYG